MQCYRKGKWHRGGSSESFLVSVLGLKPMLPINELISLAATAESDMHRTKLLSYFVENHSFYASYYRPNSSPAFLPSSNQTGKIALSSPSQCYSHPGSAPLGFMILREDLRVDAEKLGVVSHPSTRQLIAFLESTPPKKEIAQSVFEYLATRVSV